MEEVLLEATGINGRLMLLRNVVRIQRFGMVSFLRGASRVERGVVISHIKSIRFGRAGWFSRGYIEISAAEDESGPDDEPGPGGECIVSFKSGQQRAFEAFREVLVEKMGGTTSRTPAAASSDLDELDKLASLRDRRIITEEEFNHKKRRLLGL